MSPSHLPLIVRRFSDLCDYQKVWQLMHDFTEQRSAETTDEVWLLEHHHVFTQGKAGKPEHVLAPGNVPIVQTDRGGQVTYHGPGQLIIYPLFDLRRLKLGVKKFVAVLEDVTIAALAEYSIKAVNRSDAPGVYIAAPNDVNGSAGAKICSLGLRIHNSCSYHGLALNVNTDLSYFRRINPCGYKNLAMAKINDFVPGITAQDDILAQKIICHLQKKFGFDAINIKSTKID
jgi:lipoyl(octanoyl) transferase